MEVFRKYVSVVKVNILLTAEPQIYRNVTLRVKL